MKDNKSATFKYNNITDSKIFDSLENKVIDKSQFIKNALYYYIIMIEKGVIVDRNLPQDLNSISDNVNQLLNFISQNNLENKENNDESLELNDKKNEEYEIPEHLKDVDEDDYDF